VRRAVPGYDALASLRDARQVENWVRAFDKKVRAIADRAPCPAP
jgi:hypothetical protein